MPKVSVIVPVYNVEKYLRQCLDSVINQTLKDIEIICVDDKSPDGSSHILKEYALRDNRIKIIKNEENKGTGYSRNIAISQATGDYIMLLDSDDWYEEYTCEKAYNQISQNDDDIAFFNFIKVFEFNNSYLICNYTNKMYERYGNNSINFSQIDKSLNFFGSFHWSAIYKKEFLIKNSVKYTDSISCEDIPFRIKATVNADKISVINDCLYNYRITQKQTKTRKLTCIDDTFNNIILGLNYVLESKYKDYFLPLYITGYSPRIVGELKLLRLDNSKEFQHKCFNMVKDTLNLFNKYYDLTTLKHKKNYKVKALLKANSIFQYKVYYCLYKLHLLN